MKNVHRARCAVACRERHSFRHQQRHDGNRRFPLSSEEDETNKNRTLFVSLESHFDPSLPYHCVGHGNILHGPAVSERSRREIKTFRRGPHEKDTNLPHCSGLFLISVNRCPPVVDRRSSSLRTRSMPSDDKNEVEEQDTNLCSFFLEVVGQLNLYTKMIGSSSFISEKWE